MPWPAAAREAQAAFGDGTLYAERMIAPARHIEVQLLGDRHGGLAVLGERDCSVQRRHQKLVEETPSPAVTPDLRAALAESARRVAGTVDFHSAATVEFLLDADGGHYFLEMNTRLQVEHGVTELVTGIDIVAWQIRVAEGMPLDTSVLEPRFAGHAIEVRIYAEDPYHGFRPVAGTITAWHAPDGPGIRVDHAVAEGRPLTAEYDPLLAKLMVHAHDRPAAVARLRRALDETLVGGLQTDVGFHRWLVDHPGFVEGDYHTGLIGEQWPEASPPTADDLALAAAAAIEARQSAAAGNGRVAGHHRGGPFGVGQAGTPPGPQGAATVTDYEAGFDGDEVQPAAGWTLDWVDRGRGIGRLTSGQASRPVIVEGAGSEWFVTLAGRRIPISVTTWRERLLAEVRGAAADSDAPVDVRATLPGLVVAVNVAAGDEVEEGAPLLTIEAMKMQNEVRAPRGGRIAALGVAAGQPVATGVLLLRIE